jgi:hypothetical protein
MELWPHQREAVEKLGNGKILWGDVGVGKTLTALAYYYEKVCGGTTSSIGSMTKPRDLIVITTAKKRDSLDWQKDAAAFGISNIREFSVDGVTITVDSWNNIEKYKEYENAFFIFDEQRVVGSGAWTKSFIHIARHNQWILLSATPGDTWMDYIPVFIANGWYRNKTDFTRQHVVFSYYQKFPKVERYIAVSRLVRLRNYLLVEMPLNRHTTRHYHMVDVDYDANLFERVWKDRWHVYEERPLRDVAELFVVMRKVANSHNSRLEQIRKLTLKHPKLIVFYNFDYELEELRKLAEDSTRLSTQQKGFDEWETDLTESSVKNHGQSLESLSAATSSNRCSGSSSSTPNGNGLSTEEKLGSLESNSKMTIAEWNGHKHEPIPETDSWVYLVQYVAGAEGWNCVETDAVAFYSLTYSYKNFYQAQGRIDRLNTPFTDLHYYVLKSKSLIDNAVWKSLKSKKSFNVAKTGVKF